MAHFSVKVLTRQDSKTAFEDFQLSGVRYGFGASWDVRGRDVDVDLQCVVVDKRGIIIDCAYYNNLKAARSITHSGDTIEAKKNGLQELVWVNLKKLPETVQLLIFVVAAYSGGCLDDVANGKLHVLEEQESKEIAVFEMEKSSACVDVVAVMYREDADWKLRILDLPAERGQHFMDVLPLLSQTIRMFIPSAPASQKVAFAMEKGDVLDLPMDLNQIVVGLGWDTDEGEVDLDVSGVLLDKFNGEVAAVWYNNLSSKSHGIRHTGDNRTGEGDGDDEQIIVNLDQIGQNVEQVVFVVNIYTAWKTFRRVANPYCRIVASDTGSEMCRYELKDAGSRRALIIAKISREAGGRWGFHALGVPCGGKTYKDSMIELRKVARLSPAALLDYMPPAARETRCGDCTLL